MKISVDIDDSELNKSQQKILKKNLELKTDEDLKKALEGLSKSAMLEYLSMLLKDGMPNRADEVKQERLYLMVLHYYRDRVPCEAQISSIFQLTNSKSKSLLRNTIAHYGLEIHDQIRATLRELIEEIPFDKTLDKFDMVIESEVLRDQLNLIIAQNWPTLTSISKKRGKAAEYEIDRDPYDKLKEYLK